VYPSHGTITNSCGGSVTGPVNGNQPTNWRLYYCVTIPHNLPSI
jgi:hypothetical protein